jgi:hypothetical protein
MPVEDRRMKWIRKPPGVRGKGKDMEDSRRVKFAWWIRKAAGRIADNRWEVCKMDMEQISVHDGMEGRKKARRRVQNGYGRQIHVHINSVQNEYGRQ